MSQADLPDSPQPSSSKGSMLAITVLELASNDIERLDEQLAAKVEQAPDFFNNTPLVLALDKLPEAAREIDIKALVALCRKHRLRTWPCAPASRRISKQRRCWIYRCCRLRGSRAPGRPGIEGSGQACRTGLPPDPRGHHAHPRRPADLRTGRRPHCAGAGKPRCGTSRRWQHPCYGPLRGRA